MVHTGKGKGKSTAAFGLVTRAIGNGFRVGIVQFVKGKWQTGERVVLEHVPDQVTIKAMGEGFTRSEEHTSELQSLMRISYAVFCLKTNSTHNITSNTLHHIMHTQHYLH